jgi:hypothetical protein
MVSSVQCGAPGIQEGGAVMRDGGASKLWVAGYTISKLQATRSRVEMWVPYIHA